jgi:hypothetical protein
MLKCAIGLAGVVAISGSAAAQIDIAVIHIGVDDFGTYGIENAINYLSTDPRFSGIKAIDVDVDGVPSLDDLMSFAAVMVVTDNRVGVLTGGGLGTQTGNVLDDYYLAGGRIVMTTFSGTTDIGVDGDILKYTPYSLAGFNGIAGSLNFAGADLADPSLDGVGSWTSEYNADVNEANGGHVVAYYESGELGIARTDDFGIYLVNGFPADEADYLNGTDFGLAFANALAVEAGCAADFNGDGALNILDFVAYQGAFVAGDPSADCDGNGALNILDFVCFQALFQGGC